jgi:hypothetical protein
VRGSAVGAAQGKNLGGTVRVGRGATSGLNPGGTSRADWQGATVLVVVSRVPTVEIVEPDSQKNLGQWDWTMQRGESCPYQKPRVKR